MRCQLDSLPFSPRRYANRVATDLAEFGQFGSGDLNRVLFAPGNLSHWDGAEACQSGYRET